MSTNKKSVATQALMEMDNIVSAIREESKNSLSLMLGDAVRNVIREECEKDEDEKDYEVISSKKDAENKKDEKSGKKSSSEMEEDANDEMMGGQMPQQGRGQAPETGTQAPMSADAQMGPEGAPEMGADALPADGAEGEEGEDLSDYKVGDNAYDLTGENDYDKVVKVYKRLADDDEVVVIKDGDTLSLKDNQANTEYVIDLGVDEDDAEVEAVRGEEMPQGEGALNEVSDIAGLSDDDFSFDDGDFDGDEFDTDEIDTDEFGDEFGDDEFEVVSDDDFDADYDSEDSDEFDAEMNESIKARKPMKESKEQLFEVEINLGYTDSYQDKDPIAGLSNEEPSKSGKSWHKGVPTGTKKPWAGQSKSKSDPFKETKKVEGSVNEADDMEMEEPIDEMTTSAIRGQRDMGTKKHIPAGRKEHGPEKKHHVSTEANYDMVAENKSLKKDIASLRKNLQEAYMTNVNLGKITKLFLENATSQAEKIDIINRFSNEAKTPEQAKTLYESYSRQLKKANAPLNINESSMTAKGTKELNESKGYKSNDLLKTIDLMNRIEKC